jgi:hypothetical protein
VLFAYSTPYIYTVSGLSPGTYTAQYTIFAFEQSYYPFIYPSGLSTACDVPTVTVQVPGYVQPSFSTTPEIANCGSTRDVALLPDSASGVQPYQYQIIAGPETTSTQSSPVFTGLAPGTYTFLMSDACGNSYSSNVSIDTLSVPAVTSSGGTCAGGAATFSLPVSPFYSYTWLRPDGSTSTGDTLVINPVTIADTGIYHITVTSSIGGCTSSSSTNFDLGLCTTLAETLLDFEGQYDGGVVVLHWQSAIETDLKAYGVERSTDGVNFAPLLQVKAKDGTMNSYAVTDAHPPAGVVYYRLQMVEASGGAAHYSQVITVDGANPALYNVYPRLLTGATPVTVIYPKADAHAFIRVIGVDGRVWSSIPVTEGTTTTRLDAGALPDGVYFVVFVDNGSPVYAKVVKE